MIPGNGIYAAWAHVYAERVAAAVNVGTRPTFGGSELLIEAHLLDFEGDLYGERLALDFVTHLREQRRYDGVEPLIAQIHADVEATRTALS